MKLNTQDAEVIENAAKLSKTQFKELYAEQGYAEEDAGNSWHMIRVSSKGREAMNRFISKHIDPSVNETPISSKNIPQAKTKMKTTQLNVVETEAVIATLSVEKTAEQLAAEAAASDIATETGTSVPTKAPKKNVAKKEPIKKADAPVVKETTEEIENNIAKYAGKDAKNKKKEPIIPTPVVKVDKKKDTKKAELKQEDKPKAAAKKKEAPVEGDRGDKTAKAKELILSGVTEAKVIAEKSGAAVAYVRTLLYNMRKKGEISKAN